MELGCRAQVCGLYGLRGECIGLEPPFSQKARQGCRLSQRESGAQCFEPGEGMKQTSSRTGLWPGTPDGGVLGGFEWLKLGLTHIALPWELKSGHRGLGAGRE